MKVFVTVFWLITYAIPVYCQPQPYYDSIRAFIQKYVNEHEVVKGNDRKFLQFFPPDESYRVNAKIERTTESKWFTMETSGPIKKTFRTYGILTFRIHDTLLTLHVYQSQNLLQSQQYKNYLFLPFTDLTSGYSTYEAGRYLDILETDIKGDQVVIDFNKAYNPYCAYVKNMYNCPIPPRENDLPVAILAGEKTYGKNNH
jgi:uncharacterized protein (DUF1684 family)